MTQCAPHLPFFQPLGRKIHSFRFLFNQTKRHHHVHQAHLALRPCSSPPSEVCPPSTRCWPPGPPPATPSRSPWSPPWRCLCLLGHLILQQHPHSQVSHSFPSFPGVCGSSSSAQEGTRSASMRTPALELVGSRSKTAHAATAPRSRGDALGRAAPGFS